MTIKYSAWVQDQNCTERTTHPSPIVETRRAGTSFVFNFTEFLVWIWNRGKIGCAVHHVPAPTDVIGMTEFTFKICLLSTRSQSSGSWWWWGKRCFVHFSDSKRSHYSLLGVAHKKATMEVFRAVAGGLTDCFDLSDHAPIFRFVLHTHSPLRLKNTVDNRASAAQKTIFKTTILNI
jgi:hypothetical protein